MVRSSNSPANRNSYSYLFQFESKMAHILINPIKLSLVTLFYSALLKSYPNNERIHKKLYLVWVLVISPNWSTFGHPELTTLLGNFEQLLEQQLNRSSSKIGEKISGLSVISFQISTLDTASSLSTGKKRIQFQCCQFVMIFLNHMVTWPHVQKPLHSFPLENTLTHLIYKLPNLHLMCCLIRPVNSNTGEILAFQWMLDEASATQYNCKCHAG